ncbi:oxidoreductase [Lelliottia aquatilis]|uniref:Gfo/Idh/MocA family oxidoreductase n=1 Tax=Lelliottia aquatilis TaxID=2080838 RepID=UPI000CDE711A|nr:Gfo/Idh/MocA family oxidoreductase [Lelliottia aquatilis]POZ15817.1 oxidoreductase [Lelliottia aquatilis]
MRFGFIGLGAVVETAYLPALRQIFNQPVSCLGFDIRPERELEGVTRCRTLEQLLASPIDTLFITTSSLNHLDALEQALASPIQRIVVEKPVVASLTQVERLKHLLAQPEDVSRVLALDHWMARTGAIQIAQGQLDEIVKIEGFLQEPSGFNAAGEPVALNFATGEPDTRQLQHPDGVIIDIGTHVLAMMRDTLHGLGGSGELSLQLISAKDRLGRPIAKGDLHTAEGEAQLRGTVSGIPVDIWLNKYAGPAGGQKGLRLHLRDGRIISHDRRGAEDVIELIEGENVQHWTLPGTIYARCLAEHILAEKSLYERAPEEVSRITQRRLEEVELLLELQQLLRGPH